MGTKPEESGLKASPKGLYGLRELPGGIRLRINRIKKRL